MEDNFGNIFCSPVVYAEYRLQGSQEVAKYVSVCDSNLLIN